MTNHIPHSPITTTRRRSRSTPLSIYRHSLSFPPVTHSHLSIMMSLIEFFSIHKTEEEVTGAVEEFCWRSLINGRRVREWCFDVSNVLDSIPEGERVRQIISNHPCHLLIPFVSTTTHSRTSDLPLPLLSFSTLSTISRRQLIEAIDKLSRHRSEKRVLVVELVQEVCLEYIGKRWRNGMRDAPEGEDGEVIEEIARKLVEVEFDIQLHGDPTLVRSVIIPIIQQIRFGLGFVTANQLVTKLNARPGSPIFQNTEQTVEPSVLIHSWIIRRLVAGSDPSTVIEEIMSNQDRLISEDHRDALISTLQSLGLSGRSDSDTQSLSTSSTDSPAPTARKHKKTFSLLQIKSNHHKLRSTISSSTHWFPTKHGNPSGSDLTDYLDQRRPSLPTLSTVSLTLRIPSQLQQPPRDVDDLSTSSSETFPIRETPLPNQDFEIPSSLMASIMTFSDVDNIRLIILDHLLTLRYCLTHNPEEDWYLSKGRSTAQHTLTALDYRLVGRKDVMGLTTVFRELRGLFNLSPTFGEGRPLSRALTRTLRHRGKLENEVVGAGLRNEGLSSRRIERLPVMERDVSFDLDQYIADISYRQSITDGEESEDNGDMNPQASASSFNLDDQAGYRFPARPSSSPSNLNLISQLPEPPAPIPHKTPIPIIPILSPTTTHRDSTQTLIESKWPTRKRFSTESFLSTSRADSPNDRSNRCSVMTRSGFRDSRFSSFTIREARWAIPSKGAVEIELKRSISVDGLEELGDGVESLASSFNLYGSPILSKSTSALEDTSSTSPHSRRIIPTPLTQGSERVGSDVLSSSDSYSIPSVDSSPPRLPDVDLSATDLSPPKRDYASSSNSPKSISGDSLEMEKEIKHRFQSLPISPPLSPRSQQPLTPTTPTAPYTSKSFMPTHRTSSESPSTPTPTPSSSQYLTPTPKSRPKPLTSLSLSHSIPKSDTDRSDKNRRALFRRYAIVDGEAVSPSFRRGSGSSQMSTKSESDPPQRSDSVESPESMRRRVSGLYSKTDRNYETPLEVVLSLLIPSPASASTTNNSSLDTSSSPTEGTRPRESSLKPRHNLTVDQVEQTLSRLISGEIELYESSGLDWEVGKDRIRWLIEQVEVLFIQYPDLSRPFPKILRMLAPNPSLSFDPPHSNAQVSPPTPTSNPTTSHFSSSIYRPKSHRTLSLASQHTFGRRDSRLKTPPEAGGTFGNGRGWVESVFKDEKDKEVYDQRSRPWRSEENETRRETASI